MIVQSMLSMGFLIFLKIPGTIQEYSVNIMSHMVENRKVILQNDMTQRWASIQEQESVMNQRLEQFLKKKKVTVSQMLASEELKNEFLEDVFPDYMNLVETNLTTGAFFVLTGQNIVEAEDVDGFFLRDSNPLVNPSQYSDLLMERGDKQLSRKNGIPLDTYWTMKFQMHGLGMKENEAFFYQPWNAAIQYPNADIEDLGYWSEPFVLDSSKKDPHDMITYSVPLRYQDTVYGVIGIEASVDYIYDYLPIDELNRNSQSGYAIAIEQEDGSYQAVLGQGVLYQNVIEDSDSFTLKKTDYNDFFKVKDVKSGSQSIYASKYELKLYGSHVPYQNTNWVLIGFNREEDLFGMGRKMYFWMMAALLIGLIFGLISIYIFARRLTSPIQRLKLSIDKGRSGLKEYQKSNILEVDALYDVLEDLVERQKAVENALIEEKELYQVVLETTKDAFFSYDFHNQVMDVINANERNGRYDCAKLGVGLIDLDYVYEDDKDQVREMIENIPDVLNLQFRMKLPESSNYRWFALTGNVICDTEGERWKLVGRYHDIDEQKQKEEEELRKVTIDGVTGFYLYLTGIEKLREARQQQPNGAMYFLKMDNLSELSEQNGLAFGDMILEELGRMLREIAVQDSILIRFNRNSFCIWMPEITKKQAACLIEGFLEEIPKRFDPEIFRIVLHAGIAIVKQKIRNKKAIQMARQAQMAVSEFTKELAYCCYDDISHIQPPVFLQDGENIISPEYGVSTTLVSLAFMLFGKGNNLDGQIYLLLQKMGEYYEAEDVLLIVNHSEFQSFYIEYEWHKKLQDENTEHVITYGEQEWNDFTDRMEQNEYVSWTKEQPLDEDELRLYQAEHTSTGCAFPLYDNGSIMGILTLHNIGNEILQNDRELKNLIKLSRIIQGQINQQRHDLASKAKSDFLSRMSHEIRTPMNGIIGMIEIARHKDQSPEKIQDCLQKIETSSHYLLGLINDILDMSKIESGKMYLESADFSMKALLDTIRELIYPQAAAKSVNFIEDLHLKHEWFEGDQLRISQILINLLGNAVKFTPKHGTVTLTIREEMDCNGSAGIYFEVKDTGIGIVKEDQERIFRSFEQSQSNMISGQTGTGLGLSISSRLIKMMGSSIKLKSEISKGSTFSFTLMLPLGEEQEINLTEMEEKFDGYHVLIVEDNELNAEIAQGILEEYHFNVDLVYNGKEAVTRMKQTEPGTYDLILMDIMMPVMDGLDATRTIRQMEREDCKKIPIIAMSANAFDDDLKKSIECGMNGYLSKPVEVDKMYRLLKEILKS
jgi:signal transduction histidine kinase/CheY-like chemotaxis protein/GGDEF domain-containing protein/PAS domain-containing protein